MTNLHAIQRCAITALFALLASSAALSLWVSYLCIINLPAGDVWQHVSLIEQAAIGNITASDIFQKHNYLHFIPIPKLIYALDFIVFSGSGKLTAYTSIALTLLCCLLFSCLIFDITHLQKTEKISLSLITSSWLICVLQWESFINPANLQWSGLNLGLILMAVGLRQRPAAFLTGMVLAIGCGMQWWILLIAFLPIVVARKTFFLVIIITPVLLLIWELINIIWLRHYPPFLVIAIHRFIPFSADQLTEITTSYFKNPLPFYLQGCKNLLVFITRFCMPPINQWLTINTIIWLSPIPALTITLLADRTRAWRSFTFIATAALLTAIAAGIARSYLTYAYTLRFANLGLLFVCACFVLAYAICQKNIRWKYLWWLLAILYSALLSVSAYIEASSIVQGSNHRRLSQIAYALNLQDVHVVSETPYAPLMELSYRETNERKGILATHQLGIYHSREHRIFSGQEPLPEPEVHCDYGKSLITPLKNDHAARRVTGQAISEDGHTMDSILISDNRGQALGYGINKIIGRTLAEQWDAPQQWVGFFHLPNTSDNIKIIAYSKQQRCQAETITLQP